MNQNPAFRYAQRNDLPVILSFIKGLAEYEHMSDQVIADEATLEKWLFDQPRAEVLLASADGIDVGFALFFHNFRLFWADPESIWKICSYCPHTEDGGMERPS